MQAIIYYDGECPFCSRYADYQRLQEMLGSVELVDLRTAHVQRCRLQAQGFDLDQGMVLDLDGELHAGDDAVHRLALLSTSNGLLSRLNRSILGSRSGAALVYPLLRLGRNASLLALGRRPLVSDDAGTQAWQTLFCMALGLFAFLHSLSYMVQYYATMYWTTWLVAPLGLALFFLPNSRRLFLTLVLCMSVDAWRHMPILSNHTILKNVFLAGLLGSGTWYALKGGRWRDFLDDAAPIGRAALVCMYIFGVFHKINTDFLNPDVSCAVVLWRAMPQYLSWIDTPWFHILTIYGTLVIETIILLCLLFRRTRHTGIILGIGFHGLLAMSNYALFLPFSMLTIALHLLFLDKGSALQIVQSPLWRNLMARMYSPKGLVAMALWFSVMAVMIWLRLFSAVAVVWLLAIGLLCYAIAMHGHAEPSTSAGRMLWSRLWWLNSLSVLFFVSCLSPYLGLKTAQSMNMFANLRLEGGASNHLVFPDPPGPFGYLADTVEIVSASHSLYLGRLQHEAAGVTYYDLLDKLERNPEIVVSYRRAGQLYQRQSAATLASDINAVLHPRWARNFFHFNSVDLETPKRCATDR